jgi:hypothetical protein
MIQEEPYPKQFYDGMYRWNKLKGDVMPQSLISSLIDYYCAQTHWADTDFMFGRNATLEHQVSYIVSGFHALHVFAIPLDHWKECGGQFFHVSGFNEIPGFSTAITHSFIFIGKGMDRQSIFFHELSHFADFLVTCTHLHIPKKERRAILFSIIASLSTKMYFGDAYEGNPEKVM